MIASTRFAQREGETMVETCKTTMVCSALKPTNICLSQLLNYGKSPFLIGKSTISMAIFFISGWW